VIHIETESPLTKKEIKQLNEILDKLNGKKEKKK